ncbi:hypothetical protein [Roseibium algae]|uniref:Uncharacterized protein n=1 Tax=Roseibium algae TaxID=3123038 RepID=A0ABU8TEB0_9HYPH
MLPTAPLSLQLAAALPGLDPANRLDMQIAAGFNPTTIPKMYFGGGGLANISMMLSMMVGTFVLDDLPQLEFQMEQAATSITRNLWPRLGWLATLRMQPLLNYSLIARLVLDLRALGIDPFSVTAFPSSTLSPNFRFALTPPHLKMAGFVASLPRLMTLSESLNIPPLGETGAVSALQNRLSGLASLSPPSLLIPMPLLTKLALVLESLATINMAFGDGFSPSTLGRVRLMLSLWSKFGIPIPLPALALSQKLDLLPSLEDIQLGESVAPSLGAAFAGLNFSPPKLAIAPFLNIVLALHGSLQFAIDMEPFDMCSMCPCS